MSKKAPGSNEGAILAWGMLLIILCLAGAMVTRINFVEFFFVALFALCLICIGIGLILGSIAIFIYVFRRHEGDTRTIFEILKQEYQTNKLISSYRLLFKLVGEYLAESDTYVYVIECIEEAWKRTLWSLRHPIRTVRRDWDYDLDELEPNSSPDPDPVP